LPLAGGSRLPIPAAARGGAAVKRSPAEDIVSFLSFPGVSCDRIGALEKLTAPQWTHALQWLDDSGLAFYFLQKLKDTNATGVVPSAVLSRLERNFEANQLRVEDMSRRFSATNDRFNDAGIRYIAIKGFSLIPEFCPFAPLRHQGDLDYLVDGDLHAARRVLVGAGYTPKESRSRKESIFISPGGEPSRGAEQYSPQSRHAVELHADIWDASLHGVHIPSLFSIERAKNFEWEGLAFPALADEDAFLLQVIHACHHFFTLWIRMSCLFEIAYFLNRRASDTKLWNRVEERAGDSVALRDFVVIVSEMAARLFAAPLPPLVQTWGARLRPASRVWIEHYARRWAFCELPVYQFSLFPRSNFALFLRQQYQTSAHESVEDKYAPPSSRLARIASSIRTKPSLALNASWWKRQLLFRRSVFHALAGARYVYEIPRWRWLNRAKIRRAGICLPGQVRRGSAESDFRAAS
jgi:hypothetical protein